MSIKRKLGKAYDGLRDFITDLRRLPYIGGVKKTVRALEARGSGPLSIISPNCFAGRIMQDIKMEYNSPTLGLYFMGPDYILFLKDMRRYLTEGKLRFVDGSKYEEENKRYQSRKVKYPIALLDDEVEIHFLHYHTPEEAAEKWYRRAGRVNFDNLLIIGMEQNLSRLEDIEEFDRLGFKNKLMFTTKPVNLKSNVFIEEFRDRPEVGNPYTEAPIFYRYLTKYFKQIQ